MKSTKYQLLKSDFDFACKQLKEYRVLIEDLRKENQRYKKALDLIVRGANPKPIAKKALED